MSEPRKRPARLESDESESVFKRMMRELDERPWYSKLYANIKTSFWIVRCTLNHVIGENAYTKYGATYAADNIKEDIEFGYDLNMIYYKILHGNYNNRPYPKTRDWFSKHDIKWDFFLDRQGGIEVLNEISNSIKFGDLKNLDDVKNYVAKQKENYYDEKKIRMIAAGCKLEEDE